MLHIDLNFDNLFMVLWFPDSSNSVSFQFFPFILTIKKSGAGKGLEILLTYDLRLIFNMKVSIYIGA